MTTADVPNSRGIDVNRLRQDIRAYLNETDNNPAFRHYLGALQETALADALRGDELSVVELVADSRKTQEILLKDFRDTHFSELKDKPSDIATVVDRIFLDEFATSLDRESPDFNAFHASRTIGDVTIKMREVLKGEDHPLNKFSAREEFKTEFEGGKTFPIAINGTALSYPSDGRFTDDLPQLIVLANEYQKLQDRENNALADYIVYNPEAGSLATALKENIPTVRYGADFIEMMRGEAPSFTENILNHEFTHYQAGHLSPGSMIYKVVDQLECITNSVFETITQNPLKIFETLYQEFNGDYEEMATFIDACDHFYSQMKDYVAPIANHVKKLPPFKQFDGENVEFADLDGTIVAADMLRDNHILSHILKAPSLNLLKTRMIDSLKRANAKSQPSSLNSEFNESEINSVPKSTFKKLLILQDKHEDLANNVKLLRDDCFRPICHAREYLADLGMVERATDLKSTLRVPKRYAEWQDRNWEGADPRPSTQTSHTHPAIGTDRLKAIRVFIEEVRSVRGTTIGNPQQRCSLQEQLAPEQNIGGSSR